MSALTLNVGQEAEVAAQVVSAAHATVSQDNITGEGESLAPPVWSSSDPTVCSIEGGPEVVTLRGNKAGTATVTYTYPADPNLAPATITVTVNAVTAPATGVSFTIQHAEAPPPQG